MDNQPAKTSKCSPLMRLWPWLVVLLVLLFVGFIRVRLRAMPLERDEGEYAYAGQLILQGISPFKLAYNMKLPGTDYAYALGMAIFGETPAGVHLTLLVANSLAIVFVFLLGRRLFGVTAGLVASASFGVMSVSPYVLGMAAHLNHFVILFAVPATLLLWNACESNKRWVLFCSGLLYGLAFLMRQQGICFGLFGGLFLVWRAALNKSFFSTAFFKEMAVFGAGIVLPFAILCLTYALAGDFSQFWFWTFTYVREYKAVRTLPQGMQSLSEHLQLTRSISLGLWLLAVAGPALAWLNKAARKQTLFVVAFWLFSFLGAALGFYFRSHYFILVLPAFALLIGMAVASLQRILGLGGTKSALQVLPLILFAAILGWGIFCQAPFFFRLSPIEVCRIRYQGNPFVESLMAANYIREHSAPDARIAVLGSEPEIYFYAQRHSATGYIYTYSLIEPQPDALAMQQQMMQEIETNQPEYLVFVHYIFSWLATPDSNRTIFDWFDQYTGKFYKLVGVVGSNNQGELFSAWDEQLTNAPVFAGEYITIYKRIADSKMAPAKTN